jgi:ABC-type amino acid transport substrate-binding protein
MSDSHEQALTVRIGLFPSFFYAKDDEERLTGFGVAFAQRFAASIGAALELKEFASPPAVVQALQTGACDLAFLGLNPAFDVDFTPSYLKADFTFVAPQSSNLSVMADIDVQGAAFE